MRRRQDMRFVQRGLVLVSSLLLLLVVTILAVSMFRSFGIQEKIAGNVRDKHRAVQAAESAQQYAEWWLSNGANAASAPIACTALLDANLGQGQICSSPLPLTGGGALDMSKVPWQAGGADVGVAYTPPGMAVGAASTTSGAAGTYANRPRFYISDLGKSATGVGEIYQVDAVGYGASPNTVAVVESTFSVSVSSWSLE